LTIVRAMTIQYSFRKVVNFFGKLANRAHASKMTLKSKMLTTIEATTIAKINKTVINVLASGMVSCSTYPWIPWTR
jgi:hypothetical protein